jgi:hypothetical protein
MEFQPFDLKKARNICHILIIGKKGQGKTELVKDLLLHMKYQNLVVFNPLESKRHEYELVTIPENVHEKYSEDILGTFVKQQITRVKEYRRQQRNMEVENIVEPNSCVVFDNFRYDKNYLLSKSVRMLYLNGISIRTNFIMTAQTPIAMPPMLRHNIDYIFVYRGLHQKYLKRLYEEYGYYITATFELFNKIYEQLTADPFACMVINHTTRSVKIEDQVMWYKANYEPPWRLMVDKKKQLLDIIREELMQKTWHPTRVKQCLDYDELVDIFGKMN